MDLYTDKYSFWSGWYPFGINFGGHFPAWNATGLGQALAPTNGRIELGDEWLNLLTPPAPFVGSMGKGSPSTIENVRIIAGLAEIASPLNGTTLAEEWLNELALPDGGKTGLLEAIICNIFADGLSRSGSYRVFNVTGPASEWSPATYNPRPDFDKFIMEG